MCDLGIIVEGHSEYDSLPSIVARIHGFPSYVPILNAGGIGNITKNTHEQLLDIIKLHEPRKIVITLDYRDALRDGLIENCIELKELVTQNCKIFIDHQREHGNLNLPEEIVVVIADKTYETWICADYESLRENELFVTEKITEEFTNVDDEIPNPTTWLKSKLKEDIDIKTRANRKLIYKSMNPEISKLKSRSFAKFHKEVSIY